MNQYLISLFQLLYELGHPLVVVDHGSKFQHLAGQFFSGDVQFCLQLYYFVGGVDVMSFCFNFLSHFLLTSHHQFSHLFHVQVWYFCFLFICFDLLDLIWKQDGQFWTIILFTVFAVLIIVLFVHFLNQLSLNCIAIYVRLTKFRVVLRLLAWLMFIADKLLLICIMDCPTLFQGWSASRSASIMELLSLLGSQFLSSLRIIIVMFLT